MRDSNWSLALEGGGARGAYHAGACKYLFEKHIKIDMVVGTSIGAINAAMIAQNDFAACLKIWENFKNSDIFDLDDDKLKLIMEKNLDVSLVKYMTTKFTTAFRRGGMNTDKMRSFLNTHVNEGKLRASSIQCGFATYCISDMKPVEKFIDEIPKGEVVDYLLASSRLPIFKQELFNGKYYIDGGVYNNCPINMLQEKNKKNIIAIYTNSIGVVKKTVKKPGEKIIEIIPKEPLPHMMNFDNKPITNMLTLGYYDAKKQLENLDGIKYYIKHKSDDFYFKILSNYSEYNIKRINKLLHIEDVNTKKMFLEVTIPMLLKRLGYKEVKTYKEMVTIILEYVAVLGKIERFNVYSFNELLDLAKVVSVPKNKNMGIINKDSALGKLVKSDIDIPQVMLSLVKGFNIKE